MTNTSTMDTDKSVALNEFLDYAEDWVRKMVDEESGSEDWQRVCKKIIERMLHCHALPCDHQEHPLMRLSSEDALSTRKLAQEIMNAFQEPRFRGIVHSFFHSGGMNYSDFKDLWEEYLDFMWVLGDCSDDSDSDSE